MRLVGEVDSIDSLIEGEETEQYPCLVLDNIIFTRQIDIFVTSPTQKVINPIVCYGIKHGQKKYIGVVSLTSSLILRLQFLGLSAVFWKTADEYIDFTEDSDFIHICVNRYLREL